MSLTQVLSDCTLACPAPSGDGRASLQVVEHATVVLEDGAIAWWGPRTKVPPKWSNGNILDCEGHLLTPGLIDSCRSVLPLTWFDTQRDPTRSKQVAARWKSLLRHGTTWVELKSGNAQDVDRALEQLRMLKSMQSPGMLRLSRTLRPTHFAAGTEGHDEKIEAICTALIPAMHAEGLVDAIEVLCEESAPYGGNACFGFDLDDASTVLEAAYRKKIPTRLGCERFEDAGGAALAPSFYARCAAHLNFCDELAVEALAQARTTAMLLPFAQVDAQPRPPVEELRRQGVAFAVGSADHLDGAVPVIEAPEPVERAPLDAAREAVRLFGLSQEEALGAVTWAAARVLLGAAHVGGHGQIQPGAAADLVLWNVDTLQDLLGSDSLPTALCVWIAGQEVLTS